MKYPYMVKHNGVWYSAGQEIPEGKTPQVKEPVVEPTVENAPKKGGRPKKTEA